jgi:hypothetical protein
LYVRIEWNSHILQMRSLRFFIPHWPKYLYIAESDRLCGLVVTVPGYISRVRFPAVPYFLTSSGSGTGSTQPREDN